MADITALNCKSEIAKMLYSIPCQWQGQIAKAICEAITTGESGFSGYSGFSGISGYSGLDGAAASSGFSGISGYSGLSGFSGKSGFSGYSGISGYSGSNGTSGFSGQNGVSGASGFSGTNGFSGFSGFSGANPGASGYSGFSGSNPGQSGFSGFSGANPGPSGYSGFSGNDGVSGYSGYSGLSGYSGYSGDSGISGYSGYSGATGPAGTSGFSGTAANVTADNGLSKDTPSNIQLGGPISTPSALLHDSYIDNSSFSLLFTGSQVSTLVQATNSSSGGAFAGTSTSGTAIAGVSSSSIGVSATSSTGTGLYAISNSSVGADININPTSVNSIDEIAKFQRTTQNTAANGIGGSIGLYVEDDSGVSRLSHKLTSKWSTVATATRSSEFSLVTVNSGANRTAITVFSDGDTLINGTDRAVEGVVTGSSSIGGYFHGGATGVWAVGTAFGLEAQSGQSGVPLLVNSTRTSENSLPAIIVQDNSITPAVDTLMVARYTTVITGGTTVGTLGHVGYKIKGVISGDIDSEYIITVNDGNNDNAFGQEMLSLRTGGIIKFTQGLSAYNDDAAAALGGIPVNGLYRTGSAVKIRVS